MLVTPSAAAKTFLLEISGNDITVVWSLAGQLRNAQSGALGERGGYMPPAGSGHTWEYLTSNQEKSLECV